MESRGSPRRLPCVSGLVAAAFLGAASALVGVCGPFSDVAADAFCPFVLEIFTLGITTGTTATTYDPAGSVTRLQMAAFLSRTVDGALRRGGRRAPLERFWTPPDASGLGLTTVGSSPQMVRSDGADLWVANFGGTVSRVRGSDGKLLETWTGAAGAFAVLVAVDRVFVTGLETPGALYRIDPGQPAGAVTTVASNLGGSTRGTAFDGSRVWTANSAGSVSIATPGSIPWTVTTVTAGFTNPYGALYDGANVWVSDIGPSAIFKLDSAGAILQTVTVGFSPRFPIFDGANVWVPNAGDNSVSVVRASNGTVLATLTGNDLNQPNVASFDGQRVLVSNPAGNSVSLWKAADLSSLGSVPTGTGTFPFGACSDGASFWVTLGTPGQLARF
jgi:hypothetical protein